MVGLRAAGHQAKQQGEPLVALTHSMGGQVMSGALTTLIPATPDLKDLRTQVWCAAARRVELIEELGMVLDDQDPGTSPSRAASPHLGYLRHPDFYRTLAARVEIQLTRSP